MPTVSGGFDAINWQEPPRAFDASRLIAVVEAAAFFETNGFLLLENALDQALVDTMNGSIDRSQREMPEAWVDVGGATAVAVESSRRLSVCIISDSPHKIY